MKVCLLLRYVANGTDFLLFSGSGYVRAVGKNVKVAEVGDPVLLSFDYCGSCALCKAGTPSYCNSFNEVSTEHSKLEDQNAANVSQRNFMGHPTFSLEESGEANLHGAFFGQSSFAKFSIAHEHSVVNVKGIVTDKKELQLLAPLGCGIQTGSGTVVNHAKAQKDDSICITGLGGVGLSAIMGAKLSGCRIIIAVDIVESRLELAKELGATHTVNSKKLPEGKSLVETVMEIADGDGPTITLDTTGVADVINTSMKYLRRFGRHIQVGTAPADFKPDITVFSFMCEGKKFEGAIEGSVVPSDYVPKMIEWYKQGKFPIDKLVKFYPAEKFQDALDGMHSGETVKPVLLWS